MNNTVEAKILAAYTSTPSGNRITGASAAAIALTSDTNATTGIYPLFCKARSFILTIRFILCPAHCRSARCIIATSTMLWIFSSSPRIGRPGLQRRPVK